MNPMSGIEQAPPAFPCGTTSVIVYQSRNYCGQKFTDETLLQAHIEEKHMPQCPSPNPTVSGKRERKTHCFIHIPPPVHGAHPKTDNRSSIIAATKLRQPMSGVGP